MLPLISPFQPRFYPFVFVFFVFLLLTTAIIGVCLESIKMKIFLLFTKVYPKININAVKGILTQQ